MKVSWPIVVVAGVFTAASVLLFIFGGSTPTALVAAGNFALGAVGLFIKSLLPRGD